MTVSAPDLREQVTTTIAAHLGLRASELDVDRPLALYGLDSVSAMEVVAALEDVTDRTLPDWLLIEHPTIRAVLQALEGDATSAVSASTATSTSALIECDARLPADVVVSTSVPVATPATTILLTGASGLFGAHLLRTLIDETRAQILCLVRADAGEGLARVRANLQRHRLWSDEVPARIEVLRGDLAAPRLGLDEAAFEHCSATVDAIYHAAADVDWVQSYASLRAVNVGGTVELIRLAARTRIKPLYFVSSISTCYAAPDRDRCDEQFDALPEAPSLALGYAQSKAVCEALLRQAGARGLPVQIVRPALIAGDSRTGASPTGDLIARLIKGCLEMRTAPDLDWEFDAVPADFAARSMVRLANASTECPTIHLVNPAPRSWQECVLWMRLRGYDCRLVPFAAWRAQLERAASSRSHPLAGLRGFFQTGRAGASSAAERLQRQEHAPIDSSASHRRLTAGGLACPAMSGELIGRYVDAWIEDGFLERPSAGANDPGVRAGNLRPHQPGGVNWTDPAVINEMLANRPASCEPMPRATRVEALEQGSRHSIISELTAWRGGSATGLFGLRLHFESGAPLAVVLKAKPRDTDAIDVAVALARTCDARLGEVVAAHRDQLGLTGGHLREVSIYAQAPPALAAVMPACYGTLRNDREGRWAVLLEHLSSVELLNSADTPAAWTPAHLDAALAGVAVVQGSGWLGDGGCSRKTPPSPFLLGALAAHAAPRVAAWAGATAAALQTRLAAAPEAWRPALQSAPQVLVHNDFNPRNLALRPEAAGGGFRLCAYDWELATLGAPQQDAAELLCFVLPPDVDRRTVDRWIDRAQSHLAATPAGRIDAAAWRRGVHAALAQLLVDRFAFYTLIDRVRRQTFLPRVIATCARLIELTETRS